MRRLRRCCRNPRGYSWYPISDAISRLPEQYRQVILLRDYCRGSWEFVANELGRDSSHAARQVHRRAWVQARRMVWPRLRDQPPTEPR